MQIKAIIADDHELVREALTVRLKRMGVDVVGEAPDGESVVSLAQSVDYNLILMDISMPGLNGIDATRQIKSAYPEKKILILSTYDSQDYVRGVASAGADGYLLKSADLEEMEKALQIIAMGGSYFAEPLKHKLFGERDFEDDRHAKLTSREKEVLLLLDQGLRSKEIAQRLNISTRTVEVHRRNLKQKLG